MAELSAEDLIQTYVEKFENVINMQTRHALVSLQNQVEPQQEMINNYKKLEIPNYERVRESLARKRRLELENYFYEARGARMILRDQLIKLRPDINDSLVYDFEQQTEEKMMTEGDYLSFELLQIVLTQERIHSFDQVDELNLIEKHEEDRNARMKKEGQQAIMNNERKDDETVLLHSHTLKRESQDEESMRISAFNHITETLSSYFNEMLDKRSSIVKMIVNSNLENNLAAFNAVLESAKCDLRLLMKNCELVLESNISEILDSYPTTTEFSVTSLVLNTKAAQCEQRMRKQYERTVADWDVYRSAERAEAVARCARAHPQHESILFSSGNEMVVMNYFGLVIRRENAPLLLTLPDVKQETQNEQLRCVLQREVLLKKVDDDSSEVETFAVETYKSAHMLKCYGTGIHNETRYLVFEYIPDTLLSVMKEDPESMDVFAFVRFVDHLFNGLGYLHQRNTFHGDLRPENIFLDMDRNYSHLAHFSFESARTIIERGTVVESAYAAPEAFDGNDMPLILLQKADIFSMGLLIWHAITGLEPTRNENSRDAPNFPSDGNSELCNLLGGCFGEPFQRRALSSIQTSFISTCGSLILDEDDDEMWPKERAKWRAAALRG